MSTRMLGLLLNCSIVAGVWIGAVLIVIHILYTLDDIEADEDTNHAYWVEEKGKKFEWHCSRCETVQGLSCVNMNYCPHCGAKRPWAASGCGQTLPTVDAVSVVQCKDCKYYMTIHCPCDGCCISPDWYCADGERRDNDG